MLPPKGQSASKTAVAILLIGLILVLYVLFLPPDQREQLLSGSGGSGGPGTGPYPGPGPGSGGGGIVLMDKYVGTILAQGAGNVEHPMPATTVFTAVNTQEVKFIDSLQVKASAFSNQAHTVTFRADSFAGSNYLLTFNVEEAKGPLLITLNGQPIFERAVTSRSPEPIRLPSEILQPENELSFSVASAGWAFWDANKYTLRNILVSGDIADFQGATADQTFTITPDEHQKMEKGVLEFVPQCDPRQTGRLSVQLNGNLLYSGFIDCGILTRQDVPREQLVVGSNRVGFSSTQGSYTIDRLKLVSVLKQQDFQTFYFNLPPDMWQQANVFAGRVVLTMRFSEGNTVKRGSLVVNGFQDSFQTQDFYYQATLDPNVLIPNANSVQIIPDGGSLNVPQLRVELLG